MRAFAHFFGIFYLEIGMDKFVIHNSTTLHVKFISILLRALNGRPANLKPLPISYKLPILRYLGCGIIEFFTAKINYASLCLFEIYSQLK